MCWVCLTCDILRSFSVWRRGPDLGKYIKILKEGENLPFILPDNIAN